MRVSDSLEDDYVEEESSNMSQVEWSENENFGETNESERTSSEERETETTQTQEEER